MANIRIKFLLLCFSIFATQTTKVVNGQCSTPLVNQAVYEGTQNTILQCNSPTKVSYAIKPASDPLTTNTITNYDDVVAPSYTNLYGVNPNSLIIKTAQADKTIPPISTAGLYVSFINGSVSPTTGAKLVVVREPPTCNCTANSTELNLTCSLAYADVNYEPLNAKMAWFRNGVSYKNETPVRALGKPYYTSTSSIVVDANDTADYTCAVSFTNKTNGQLAYTAKNAPEFSASCSPPPCALMSTTTVFPTSETPSTTECNCAQTTSCPSQDDRCTEDSECRSDGTDLMNVYDECVVKAELYARCDDCCPDNFICGVVVTLRNDSRWLIHDSICNDNKCEMAVVSASCMSSNWKLLTDRKIAVSGVGDYVQAGSSVQIDPSLTDCSESCKRMMDLL